MENVDAVSTVSVNPTEPNSQYTLNDEYDDIFCSSQMNQSVQIATLIATLAERFQLTSFKPFQKEVIDFAMHQKRDTLVIYPTGSGKSLCFQFPPVYENKKAVVITPTISLMQDQVYKLNQLGIPSVFLGSAQFNRYAEMSAFDSESQAIIIFATPECVSKPSYPMKVQNAAQNNNISLIAIDKAHLCSEWRDFRSAYKDLKTLKCNFPSIPIKALTATAMPDTLEDITDILCNPKVIRCSVNRPNVYLCVEELHRASEKSLAPAMQFSQQAEGIIGSSSAIIYTDFISDVGPIVSALGELGINAVGYHGELDAPSRHESYLKLKSNEVKVIVATKAFGMGINKPDIRHIVRNGVPENILSWVQELGRAGRDGKESWATILFSKGDVSHANAWILNNLSNRTRCDQISSGFADSWRYVYAHLAGLCWRKMILELFGEDEAMPEYSSDCCDVCKNSTSAVSCNHKEELKILMNALDELGCKGEVKVAEWIRGSKVSWTNTHNKQAFSYGNHLGKDITFWRTFIKQCHVVSLIKLELKSMIKANGTYAVNGIYYPLSKGKELCESEEGFILLSQYSQQQIGSLSSHLNQHHDLVHVTPDKDTRFLKRNRDGKGSHVLTIVRKCLNESENWLRTETKKEYRFPGVYPSKCQQQLFYVSDISALEQTCEDSHFIWKDIQLSKGQLNKPRLITVCISGVDKEVYYQSAPCLGVKKCPSFACGYVVAIRDKGRCPIHKLDLEKTTGCPVEFIYIHPKDNSDGRRWFGGMVRCQKGPSENAHNHPLHSATKKSQ